MNTSTEATSSEKFGPRDLAAFSAIVALAFGLPATFFPIANYDVETASFVGSAYFVAAAAFMSLSAAALHRTLIHPYVLFVGTSCLFIGGRFFAYLFGGIQSTFYDANFKVLDLTGAEAWNLVTFVVPCMLGLHAGYMWFWAQKRTDSTDKAAPLPSNFERTLAIPSAILLVICAPIAGWGVLQQYLACMSGGYLEVYQSSAEFASRSSNLAQYGLLLSMGLAFASRNRVLEILTTLCMAVVSLGLLVVGIRSTFLAFVLLATFLAHKRVRRLNVLTALIVPVALVVFAQGASVFSCRAVVEDERILNQQVIPEDERQAEFVERLSAGGIFAFIHNQGTSLLSIHVATTIPDYPLPALFQTFFPGFGVIAKLLGHPLELTDLYYGQYMAKEWMPDRYAVGEGFGWSIFSDLVVWSGNNHFVAFWLAAVLGAAFAVLISAAATSAVWFGALVVIMPKLMLLPRAGLYSIFPYLIAFMVIVCGWWVVVRLYTRWRGRGGRVSASQKA